MFERCLWYSCLVLFTALLVASPVCRVSADEGFLVGRISDVDGQLLRFVPAEKDWVATVRDAPFGMDDALYSNQDGKAEFIMPNNTWVRIGGSTQVQLIALKPDVTEIDVASGVARLYNKSSNALIKATTPFGYVVAQPESTFDLYVGDQSAEVITLSGRVDFIHAGDNRRYEVVQGSSSLIADAGRVGTGDASVDASWDNWNVARDSLWAKRMSVRGDSAKYLPPRLHDEAYELEENGRWETVSYEGRERHFWRPTRVGSGWAPFTAGRWTEYYGDDTWIPDEPFGYTTHHYGNWVYLNNAWYWGPPGTVGVGLDWYPGRVAWIGSGADVGWVPLAPNERYYSHHAWGPAATVIGTAAVVGLAIGSLAYLNHAVVVPQHDFYGVNNYNRVRVRDINRTMILSNYKTAPVVNNTIFKNYNTDRNRYNFTDAKVADMPHNTVLKRIEHNQGIARQEGTRVNANTLRQNITRTKPAPLPTQTRVAPPNVTSKIVPVSQVNKPASEVKFQPGKLKEKPRHAEPPKQGVAGQPAVEPGKALPGKPGEKIQPAEPKIPGQGPTTPPKPGEIARPGETRQPVESSGPPKSPGDQMMKPGEAGPKAPGTGHEPQPQQQRPAVKQPQPRHEPQAQPQPQQPHPAVQQPQPRHEPQAQPQQPHPAVQQPQPRHEPQAQPQPQQQRPAVKQPQPRHEPQAQPQPQQPHPAVQQPQPRHEPQAQPQPQQPRPAVQQPQPRHQQQPPQKEGDDKDKQKQKGHEQPE
jgi:hypothetical protein